MKEKKEIKVKDKVKDMIDGKNIDGSSVQMKHLVDWKWRILVQVFRGPWDVQMYTDWVLENY